MKKIIAVFMAALLASLMLTSCNKPENTDSGKKLKIVSTIFPQYDWVRQILGDQADEAELTLLLDKGVDLHNYQPTADDIIKVSNSDLFIYVGGESDAWVEDALKNAANKNMVVINLLEVLGDAVKEEEIKEGMEHDEHDHEVDVDDVKDRPLSDWQGDWVTIEDALANGDLDEYVAHQAQENETDAATQKAAYEQHWKSDYANLKITGTSVTFGGVAVDYEYAGYKIVEGANGAAVWYGFAAKTPVDTAPKFIAFSDHGTGGEEDHEDEDEDEHETAHFHMRYGNESFEALTEIENWSPTFFPSDAAGEEIAEAMSGHGHSHEGELDEHVWLSLKNAQVFTSYIADKLAELDADNTAIYKANAESYNTKLGALDGEYRQAVNKAATKTLLFADRFPFRYLVDDYGLDYYAAFSGCSAETEASFETVVFLAEKTNGLNLKHVMVIESSDKSMANTVIQNTAGKNQSILVLNSLQSVTAAEVSAGTTYLSVMESNLEVLKEAMQ
ncbi:MAG: zinc ABC transporter substrate-binding protein [Oscillospiraceae bacterium]|nr:zinc ABC transporter substrate-binding protein [Oscillospiraceae bacterium]